MSNRSLVEFNHDLTGEIERNPIPFTKLLVRYLTSGSATDAELLKKYYGMTVFGMRQHLDGFEIKWGATECSE